ncbi:MAG: hypothetical protein ABW106_16165 [Steroidobacteraceae bacterium]
MGWFGRKRPSEEEDIRVARADARVADKAALTILLEALPEAGELGAQLSNRFFARAWDKATNRDYWVVSDGTRATCFTLTGLNLKQAAAVRVRWDALTGQLALTERVLGELVSAETRTTVQVVSYVRSEQADAVESAGMLRSA